MFDYKGKWALITGASAGIGEAFAIELAKKGANLVLVARRKDKLLALSNQINKTYNVNCEIIQLDLANVTAPHQLYEEVQKRSHIIQILVNNAGVGVYGMLHETDIKKNEQLILLNVFSPSLLTQLFLPSMLQAQEGIIINVASTAAFQPLPYMSNYGASKAFLLSFSEAIWAEYHSRGLNVLAICPGPVETEFFSVMNNKMPSLGKRDSAEMIAQAALQAIEQQRMYLIPGAKKNYWLAQISRFVPRKLVAKMTAHVMLKNKEK